jgi:hypothetical protein
MISHHASSLPLSERRLSGNNIPNYANYTKSCHRFLIGAAPNEQLFYLMLNPNRYRWLPIGKHNLILA